MHCHHAWTHDGFITDQSTLMCEVCRALVSEVVITDQSTLMCEICRALLGKVMITDHFTAHLKRSEARPSGFMITDQPNTHNASADQLITVEMMTQRMYLNCYKGKPYTHNCTDL